MSHPPGPNAEGQNAGFERLLALLHADPAGQAARFETVRQRLNRLFLWRGSSDPDTLTDETLDRAAAKLAAGVVVEANDPFRYLAGIARLVSHEAHHRERRTHTVLEDVRHQPDPAPTPHEDGDGDEDRHRCLERCLGTLGPGDREQILDFYRGDKSARIARRKALAQGLGISVNALRIRAHRIRTKLETCVRACLAETTEVKHSTPHHHQRVTGPPPWDETRP